MSEKELLIPGLREKKQDASGYLTLSPLRFLLAAPEGKLL